MDPNTGSSRSVSILIPVFNEARIIRQTLDELYAKCLNRLPDFELLMLEDGSKDDTAAVLKACESAYPNLVAVTDSKRIGYAASVKRGIAMAKKDWILLMDGDGQIEPEDIWLMLKSPMDWDVVSAEKFPRCDPSYRIIVSRLFDVVTDVILGIHIRDINFGFKLMRADAAKRLAPQCCKLGEIYTAELMMRFVYAGYRLQQMRVRHRKRTTGSVSQGVPPSVLLRKSWKAFRGLLELRKELTSEKAPTP
ncbi:MAG: glycosyltransferase family 2 protein [bacterium]